MKTISHEQSRKNSARRKRKVWARHARAGSWRPQARPMFGPGKVHYEIGARISAMSFGGIGAVRRLVAKLGLPREIDRRLELLKVHLPYHESDHVLNIAYSLLCGSVRLEDLGGLRNNVAYMDALGAELIPSPTAAGDFTRRFSEADVTELMECINSVRPQLWRGRARDLLGPVAYIDVDGTLAPTLGRKKAGMDMSYKKVWGYHPLVISLANTNEVLYLVNRPGNAVSHRGAAAWIDKAIALVAPHAERVCVRGDTDFSLTVNFDRWSEKADFIFGFDAQPAIVKRAEALEDDDWARLERRPRYTPRTGKTRSKREDEKARIVRERGYANNRLDHEDVAEYEYSPAKCRETYRMVVVRKNISKSKGELTLVDTGPLLLLHHHPPGSERGRGRPAGQRPLRPGERGRAAEERSERAAGAAVRPREQLGLHGHGGAGVEPQELVRPDDAPQGRPPEVHRHGVPPLHPRDDPAALPGHPPGPAHDAADHRLAAHHRPAVQHLAHDREDRLRLTTLPLPCLARSRRTDFGDRCPPAQNTPSQRRPHRPETCARQPESPDPHGFKSCDRATTPTLHKRNLLLGAYSLVLV